MRLSTRRPLASFALAGLGALFSFAAAGNALADDTKGFFDDFDTLNTARWYVSDGWSNGTWQNCGWSAKEISASGGMLNVGFSHNPAANRPNRCGEIQTKTKFSYGTYEARLKTPSGAGLNAAFFTYIANPHDEIDMEFLLKDTSKVSTTTFVNGKSGNGEKGGGNGQLVPLPQPSDQGFVDYAMVWAPDKVEFYADKKLIRTIDAASQSPTTPQKIFFSLWGSDTLSDWLGTFSEPEAPIAMQVDWVAYTPPDAHCLFPQSITCSTQ